MSQLSLAFTTSIVVGDIQTIGETAKGTRKMIPILGGHFEGDHIKGDILPGGADWQLIRPDGVAEIEAHYTMQTDDNILIYIVNRGYRYGPASIMNKLARGEEVPASSYYFRSTATFEVSAGKYEWLTRTVFIGIGEKLPDCVTFNFFSVL